MLCGSASVSEDGKLSGSDIGDYLASNVLDPLQRVQGVGGLVLFGAQYAMRLWLNPDQLNTYGLTPSDVITAVQAQNALVSAGQLGATPAVPGQWCCNVTVTAQGRLQTPEQFGNIILRSNTDGLPTLRSCATSRESNLDRPAMPSRLNSTASQLGGFGVLLASAPTRSPRHRTSRT